LFSTVSPSKFCLPYLKESIIYESFHEPEKFVPISEALNNDKKSSLFIQGLLAKQLQKNNITTVIKKDPNEKISHQHYYN